MNLRIHRLAVAQIDYEVDYYESRQAGLGTELEDEIDAAFSLILRFPEAAPQGGATGTIGVWLRSIAFRSRFPIRLHMKTSCRCARTHKPSARIIWAMRRVDAAR